jgi:hypothetical protein
MALLSGLANAQIGVRNGPANSQFSCTASATGIPQIRPEGYTETVSDILITCTGGAVLTAGSPVPTADITAYITPNTPITSRILGPNGASEALLMIDEPGSNLATGATGGYGPQAPQSLCTTAQQQTAGGSACAAYVGADTSGNYQVAVQSDGSTPAQNVYQGAVGYLSRNSVTFFNVPVLPPAYRGVSRIFRITNVRVPAGLGQSPFQMVLSTSPSAALPVPGSPLIAGLIGSAMNASVDPAPAGGAGPFSQCMAPPGPMLSAHLSFTEGPATFSRPAWRR